MQDYAGDVQEFSFDKTAGDDSEKKLSRNDHSMTSQPKFQPIWEANLQDGGLVSNKMTSSQRDRTPLSDLLSNVNDGFRENGKNLEEQSGVLA